MLHSKAEFSGGSSLSCSEATGATACTASCAKTDVSAIFPGGECAPAELYRLFFKCFKTHKTLLPEQWLGGCRVVPLSATCSQGRKIGADNVPDPPKPTFEWVSGVASLPQYIFPSPSGYLALHPLLETLSIDRLLRAGLVSEPPLMRALDVRRFWYVASRRLH